MTHDFAICLVRSGDLCLRDKNICKKILCPQGRGFLAMANSDGRRQKDCSRQSSLGVGVKKANFLITSNLKTIFSDFP
ncbi:hypothetical protein QUB60_02125 [Microcoleus sp. A2-C5]|uniref:hypothetical protein n=1 Tax=Microcoleaceae TaxID=1892252 RepID=UPI002237AAE6|nr:hypothetical protein [Lyngbya sp. CCAP 1446/10]MCW6051545.1 hypothetical protein [Lyngbya sp. CCAP 1446/10]